MINHAARILDAITSVVDYSRIRFRVSQGRIYPVKTWSFLTSHAPAFRWSHLECVSAAWTLIWHTVCKPLQVQLEWYEQFFRSVTGVRQEPAYCVFTVPSSSVFAVTDFAFPVMPASTFPDGKVSNVLGHAACSANSIGHARIIYDHDVFKKYKKTTATIKIAVVASLLL